MSERNKIHGDMVESYIKEGINERGRSWIGLRWNQYVISPVSSLCFKMYANSRVSKWQTKNNF
jgi:hypothetical protein